MTASEHIANALSLVDAYRPILALRFAEMLPTAEALRATLAEAKALASVDAEMMDNLTVADGLLSALDAAIADLAGLHIPTVSAGDFE